MQQLHHSNLLSFLTVVDEGRRISLVMEWAGECLREARTLTQPQQYSEELVRHIMYQLTHALSYLHHKVRLLGREWSGSSEQGQQSRGCSGGNSMALDGAEQVAEKRLRGR